MSSVETSVRELNQLIASGKIIEAMERFYDKNASMQENSGAPTVGLERNIEREKQFLAQVAQWIGYEVKAVAAGPETAFIESTIDFVNTNGQRVHMEQVSVQRWKNGKIVHERFYYDTGTH